MMMYTLKPISYWLDRLNLVPHPEGGFYAETYRSTEIHRAGGDAFPEGRSLATGIYFLIGAGMFSAFHRIRSDEMWHHYYGCPLEIHVIDGSGRLTTQRLGLELERGERPQYVVPSGHWFASSVSDESGYALVGCTVAPGFDFEDFELADRATLTANYPEHAALIARLTRV